MIEIKCIKDFASVDGVRELLPTYDARVHEHVDRDDDEPHDRLEGRGLLAQPEQRHSEGRLGQDGGEDGGHDVDLAETRDNDDVVERVHVVEVPSQAERHAHRDRHGLYQQEYL